MLTIYYGGNDGTERNTLVIVKLFGAPKFWSHHVFIGAPGHHHCRVASHKAKSNPLEELPSCNPLLLSCLSGKGRGKPLELDNCNLVKSSQSFHGNGEERETLLLAGSCGPLNFPVIGGLERASCLSCSSCQKGNLV